LQLNEPVLEGGGGRGKLRTNGKVSHLFLFSIHIKTRSGSRESLINQE